MNICFISPYPPSKDGIGKYTERTVQLLTKNGFNCTVITNGVHNTGNSNESTIYDVISLNPFSIIRIINVIKAKKTDIISIEHAIPAFGFLWFYISLACIISKVILRKKIIISLHEVSRELELLKLFAQLYFIFLSVISNEIIVHTDEAKSLLISRCRVRKEKISVIPLGLYIFITGKKDIESMLIEAGVTNEDIILCFGFIHTDKGIDVAIKSYNQLLLLNEFTTSTTKLLIVGSVRARKGLFKIFEKKDIEYYEYLHKLAHQTIFENNIVFLPYLEDAYVESLFRKSKMLLLPYTKVEQSGVLNMAIATELPVIASNISGLSETLRVTGILFDKNDQDTLTNEIYSLVSDKKYYESIKSKYKILKSKLNLESYADLLVRYYRGVVYDK